MTGHAGGWRGSVHDKQPDGAARGSQIVDNVASLRRVATSGEHEGVGWLATQAAHSRCVCSRWGPCVLPTRRVSSNVVRNGIPHGYSS
jgi:hypothetical protein